MERKENLRNIMKGLDVKNFNDLKDVFKMMVGEMLENDLDGELDDGVMQDIRLIEIFNKYNLKVTFNI